MACSDNKFFIKISTHILIMEVDFCPVLCIPEVPFKIKASQNLHKIISTHLLTVLIIYVILHIEQRERIKREQRNRFYEIPTDTRVPKKQVNNINV